MNILNDIDLNGKLIKICNCYVVKNERLVKEDLWIRNGLILDGLHLFYFEKSQSDIIVDGGGNIISPGLIDIQVNGAYGYDFSNTNGDPVETCDQISEKLPETGVTAFCPTIITSCQTSYSNIIPKFKNYKNKSNCAKMLGLHLEGPFISKKCAGMHPTCYITDFGIDPIKTLTEVYGSDFSGVRLVTVAPELEGASDAIQYLVSKNVVVSVGHTDAEYEAVQKAVSCGASFVTHLFNAMPAFHHRKAHIYGQFTSAKPRLYMGLISDLVHVHPAVLCLSEAISPGHVVLVTDSNTAFGLPDGLYTFGVQKIQVTEGLAFVADTDHLAGATTPLLKCVRNFWLEVTRTTATSEPGIPSEWQGLGQALAAASTRPATVLRLNRNYSYTYEAMQNNQTILPIGSLVPGSDADFLIISPTQSCENDQNKLELKLLCTWINGKPVFSSPDCGDYINIRMNEN